MVRFQDLIENKVPLKFGDEEQIAAILAHEIEEDRRARMCHTCDGEGQVVCNACDGTGERPKTKS